MVNFPTKIVAGRSAFDGRKVGGADRGIGDGFLIGPPASSPSSSFPFSACGSSCPRARLLLLDSYDNQGSFAPFLLLLRRRRDGIEVNPKGVFFVFTFLGGRGEEGEQKFAQF